MKAIIRTKRGLELQDVEFPIWGRNDILVKVHSATVTRGDVILSSLPAIMYWQPIRKLIGMPPKKITPGHEFAGIVEKVGQDVTRFKVGDPIFGTTTGLSVGANAEYVCVPEDNADGVLAHKPESISYDEATALPVGGMTALFLLKDSLVWILPVTISESLTKTSMHLLGMENVVKITISRISNANAVTNPSPVAKEPLSTTSKLNTDY